MPFAATVLVPAMRMEVGWPSNIPLAVMLAVPPTPSPPSASAPPKPFAETISPAVPLLSTPAPIDSEPRVVTIEAVPPVPVPPSTPSPSADRVTASPIVICESVTVIPAVPPVPVGTTGTPMIEGKNSVSAVPDVSIVTLPAMFTVALLTAKSEAVPPVTEPLLSASLRVLRVRLPPVPVLPMRLIETGLLVPPKETPLLPNRLTSPVTASAPCVDTLDRLAA